MLESIHHTSVLIVEQLQNGSVALINFDKIVHLLLQCIHRRSVLVEITCEHDNIFFLVVLWVFKCFLLNEPLHLFDLLITADKGFDIERHTTPIVTSLEMRMEQMELITSNLRQIDLCIKDTFLSDCIVTNGREFVIHKVRVRHWILGNGEKACITAIRREVLGLRREGVVGHTSFLGLKDNALLSGR